MYCFFPTVIYGELSHKFCIGANDSNKKRKITTLLFSIFMHVYAWRNKRTEWTPKIRLDEIVTIVHISTMFCSKKKTSILLEQFHFQHR